MHNHLHCFYRASHQEYRLMIKPATLALALCLVPFVCLAGEPPASTANPPASTPAPEAAPAEQAAGEKPAPKALSDEEKASLRHDGLYLIEHQFMPSLWLGERHEMFDADLHKRGVEVLRWLIGLVNEDVGTTIVETEGIAVEEIDLGNDWKGWLVTFPEPKVTPESKYSLLLSNGEQSRFFAWEFDNLMEKTTWYLCEWTNGGNDHLNYGDHKDGSKEKFIALTKKALGGKEEVKAGISRGNGDK